MFVSVDFNFCEQCQALKVGRHIGLGAGWRGAVVVKVNSFGVGIAVVRKLLGFGGGNALEVNAHGVVAVGSKARVNKANGLVIAIKKNVAAVGLLVDAVNKMGVSQYFLKCHIPFHPLVRCFYG